MANFGQAQALIGPEIRISYVGNQIAISVSNPETRVSNVAIQSAVLVGTPEVRASSVYTQVAILKSDSSLLQRGFSQSAALIDSPIKVNFAQTLSRILVTSSVYAQTMANIYIARGWGQAQAAAQIIVIGKVSAQALAWMLAFDVSQVGQSLAFVGHLQYCQANAHIIIIGHSTVFAQTLAFVGHFKHGQAQASIKTAYTVSGQAATLIWSPFNYASVMAEIITTTPNAQANALIRTTDINASGQALCWIGLPLVGNLLFDNFERADTTAPPFNLGVANTGQTWTWTNWDTSRSEATSPYHVEGGVLVGGTSGYDSFYAPGASLDVNTNPIGEFIVDFWVPVITDNSWQYIFYANQSWYAGINDYGDGTLYVQGWDGYGSAYWTVTRSAWARARFQIDLTGASGYYVRGHVWTIGDTEPATWANIQTSGLASSTTTSYTGGVPSLLVDMYYESSTVNAQLDNITLQGITIFPYNQGYSQAQARILAINYPPAQAQASLNQAQQAAQSQASIQTYDNNRSAHTQAFISKSKGVGLALGRIRIEATPGTYRYEVYNDGAIAYYSHNTRVYGSTTPLIDELNNNDITLYRYGYSNSNVTGYVEPDLAAERWYYNDRWYTSTSFINSGTPQWSAEFWVLPNAYQSGGTFYGYWWSLYDYNGHRINLKYGSDALAGTGNNIYVVEATSSATYTYNDGGYLDPNSWHHIVITSDNGNRNLYIDGSLAVSWSGTDYVWTYMYFNYEGYYSYYSNQYFSLDDNSFYDIELTPTQVQDHYDAARTEKIRYGQALAFIGHFQSGQSAAQIDSPHKLAFGQASVDLPRRGGYGQANALIQPRDGLVGGIWTGGAYNSDAIGGWYSEHTPGKPYYNGTITPPGYSDTTYFGMSWSGTFIADVTGTWTFKSTTDDGSKIVISGPAVANATVTSYFTKSGTVATMNNNYGGSQGTTTRTGTITLVEGERYTIQAAAGQNTSGFLFSFYYRRPDDAADNFLTDSNPPWIDIGLKGRYAQAQAKINSFDQPHFAQALSYVGHFKPGIAQADIKQGRFTRSG